jgi:iron complex outermembrane recepter protein
MNFKTTLLIGAAVVAMSPLCALAQTVTPAGAAKTAAELAAEAASKTDVETIVVTATRRNEAANKIPYNITVQSEAALRAASITDLKSLIADNVAINAPQNSARFADSVTVRGLNVSPVNANNLERFVRSTVSFYLDDTPLPNIGFRIKDIARVETLLGPQGTLYGGGSLGGTIRYITNKPKLGAFEGRVSTSIYQTQGGDMSGDTDLVLNAPIGDKAAFRISLAYLDEGGYTDRLSNPPWRTGANAWTTRPNLQQNLYKNDDWQKVKGGRASFLWQPTENLEFIVAHARQSQEAHGTSGTQLQPLNFANATTDAQRVAAGIFNTAPTCAGPCQYTRASGTPFAQGIDTIVSRYPDFANRDFEMTSLDVDYQFSFARLHSSTSSYKDTRAGEADYFSQGVAFYNFGFINRPTNPASDRSAYVKFDNAYEGITHETRLVSTTEGRFNWIAGFFYTNQKSSLLFDEIIPGGDAVMGNLKFSKSILPDSGYREDLASDYTETAIYGEVGIKITDRWRANVSARIFNYEDKADQLVDDYATGGFNETVKGTVKVDGTAFYRFNTSFDITPDILTYFTFSQGYRRGGINAFRSFPGFELRPEAKTYDPDSTDNFELGVKGRLFNQRLYIAANVYQIKWNNTQSYRAQPVTPQDEFFELNGTFNAPDATSQGFEFNSRLKLSENWSVAYAAATSKAKWDQTGVQCLYTTDNPAAPITSLSPTCTVRFKNGTLGGAPDLKQTFSVNYNKTLIDGSSIFARVSGRIIGEIQNNRCDDPTASCTALIYPSYTPINFSMGWSNQVWDASMSVTNFTNERALVSVQGSNGSGNRDGLRAIYTRPLTAYFNISYKFN